MSKARLAPIYMAPLTPKSDERVVKWNLSLKELVDTVKRNKYWLDKAKTEKEKEIIKKDIISARRIIIKCLLFQNSDNELLENITIDI